MLGRDGKNPPVALGVFCSEGPAVSRQKLQIAWAEWRNPGAGEGDLALSKIYLADIAYTDGKPALANRQLLLDGSEPGYRCTMETQNFNPQRPSELIFNTYTDRGQKCDALGVNLETKKLMRYTNSPAIYDEAEGVFPDGEFTLVECDEQHPGGPANIDLWKLALDGSGRHTRLTYFSDYPGYKAANGVVSDDGKIHGLPDGPRRRRARHRTRRVPAGFDESAVRSAVIPIYFYSVILSAAKDPLGRRALHSPE
ncbi:MAG: hypothetical protein WDM96_01130 [Lacunisphaera sp.]